MLFPPIRFHPFPPSSAVAALFYRNAFERWRALSKDALSTDKEPSERADARSRDAFSPPEFLIFA